MEGSTQAVSFIFSHRHYLAIGCENKNPKVVSLLSFFFRLWYCISFDYILYMGVSTNSGTPKWILCSGKPLFKWMIWGENPLCSETSI